jgi:purine-binding chemotaxis protein CheW
MERLMSNLAETKQNQIVVFTLDEPRYALYLAAVERVVRAVEITLLPKVPEIVLGVINVQGQIVPVVDVRKRLHLPAREMRLDDQFIIARTSRRLVALVVDSVVGCRELADRERVPADQVFPGAEYIRGLAKLNDGLVLICDLDQFLAFGEEQILDAALPRDRDRNEA